MLYVEFKILDAEKFIDFQKLYLHMVKLRDPGFELKEAEAYAELKKKQDKEQFNKELRDEPEIPKLSLWELIIIIIIVSMLVYQYFTIARKFI
jgi:hypothetical protein